MKDIPPQKLYKYQPCSEYTFNNLKNGSLWFAKPKNFNDPFDCSINFNVVDTTEENLKKCFDWIRSAVQDKKKFDRTFLQDGRINKEFESFIIKATQDGTDEHLKEWNQVGVVFRKKMMTSLCGLIMGTPIKVFVSNSIRHLLLFFQIINKVLLKFDILMCILCLS